MSRKKKFLLKTSRTEDYHHLLFQRRHWQQGYAKTLREHPYMGIYIPRDTLHRALHSKIHDVPTPNGAECRLAVETLRQLEKQGAIDPAHDSAEKRLDFLIDLWGEKCPATVAVLAWEKDVIAKYFKKGG